MFSRRAPGWELDEHLLKQRRLILALELDIEGDAGHFCHGNLELNGLEPNLIELRPEFVHRLGERDFRLLDVDREGGT
jgi:hypothetical protein